MDLKEKIQLGEDRFIDAVNVDTTIKIGLDSNTDLNVEYDLKNVLDVTQIFDAERQEVTKYRIYGEFEYFSILNGLFKDYTNLEFFFSLQPASADTKTIFTDLKIYLVKPSTGFTELITDERYIKNYEILTEINDFEIVQAGFAKSIFDEQQYSFIINQEIDIRNMIDGLGFPITELALYVEYQPSENGVGDPETMETKTYDAVGTTVIQNFTPIPLTIGDVIVGDVIDYEKILFQQTDFNLLEQFIYTTYEDTSEDADDGKGGTGDGVLKWKYRPIIPIRLRYFENEVRRANTGSTAYEEVVDIPYYATQIDNDGNFVWRNILDNGFFDPLDNIGVAFPFINQKHYVFNNIVFNMQPDLDHFNTKITFSHILFPDNTLDSATPDSDLDKIGDICN